MKKTAKDNSNEPLLLYKNTLEWAIKQVAPESNPAYPLEQRTKDAIIIAYSLEFHNRQVANDDQLLARGVLRQAARQLCRGGKLTLSTYMDNVCMWSCKDGSCADCRAIESSMPDRRAAIEHTRAKRT